MNWLLNYHEYFQVKERSHFSFFKERFQFFERFHFSLMSPTAEICAISKISKKEIGRCFKLILRALETSVDLITSGDFMVSF